MDHQLSRQEPDLRIADIVAPTYVDGPGKRAALFLQGCSIRCLGCQNPHLWPAAGGDLARPEAVAQALADTGLPVTITGGEPFDQVAGLYRLLAHLRHLAPDVHIIVYTGRTWEELLTRGRNRWSILAVLALTDVLVDGPYVRELDDAGMQYRGSRNQRPIDVWATIEQPLSETFGRGPVVLDWDTEELVITAEGDVLGASPLVERFAVLGVERSARRCGEI